MSSSIATRITTPLRLLNFFFEMVFGLGGGSVFQNVPVRTLLKWFIIVLAVGHFLLSRDCV